MISDQTISTLTLPEKQEEAIKRIKTLQTFLMSSLNAALDHQNRAKDLAKEINHLSELYIKKYSKPVGGSNVE
jgi:hypothetical protein